MNKDVIYIDVEDDITAIIGKVKGAKEKIVALVPPKRIGVLQSAVNLQLLVRAATQADKRLVLITNNSALMALSSAAKIPVAKNLQSKPEVAEIPALEVDNDDDIIDGASLPVGELERTADTPDSPVREPLADAALASAAVESPVAAKKSPIRAVPPAPGQAPVKPRAKSGVKVPNFNSFRKKLLLIGGGLVLLIAFLVWAIFFAPHATVVIAARTTDASLNNQVTLTGTGDTSVDKQTIKMTTQQLQKDVSFDFTPTGQKNDGAKATGSVYLQACNASFSPPSTVPAGTTVTYNGNQYVTGQDATFSQSDIGNGCIVYKSNSVAITAAEGGADYNVSNNSSFTVSGHSDMSAYGTASGGTDKTVAVVTQADIQKAKEDLTKQDNTDLKNKLKGQFGKNVVVITDTFKIDGGDVQSTPDADQEAPDGKAKLTGSITYTMAGVSDDELNSYLNTYFKQQLDNSNDQRIYDNGLKNASFTNVSEKDSTFLANLTADAKIGPKINDAQVKKTAEGKRYGEIQSQIEAIQGVDNVDIKFSPFWVSKAPNDTKRISVEFKLNGSK